MITSTPRPSAVPANSAAATGVRCAESTRHSWATSKRASGSAAWRLVSQSDLLPMTIATSGSAIALLALAQRVAGLAVEVAQVLRLDEVESGGCNAVQERYDLLMRDVRVGSRSLEPAAPVVQAKCFGRAIRP